MEQRRDQMQNTETPQSCFSSAVLQQFFTAMNTKRYHTSVPRKAKIQFCTKHLFVFFFFLYKNNSRHVTQMCVWYPCVSYGRGATEITLKPQSENGQEKKVPGPSRELNLFWLRRNFSLSVSFFKRASRRCHSCSFSVEMCHNVPAAQQQQYYHLTGLAIYRQCCHKTNTTVYKNNR